VDVVGGNKGQPERLGERDQLDVDANLIG
jgi:hypothetical protein